MTERWRAEAREQHIKLNVASRRAGYGSTACEGEGCHICAVLIEAFTDIEAQTREEMRWQPIATAPGEGTMVLFLLPKGLSRRTVAERVRIGSFRHNRWWSIRSSHVLSSQPTHWMPLPPCPEKELL